MKPNNLSRSWQVVRFFMMHNELVNRGASKSAGDGGRIPGIRKQTLFSALSSSQGHVFGFRDMIWLWQ
jgi:hypothetical protein